MSIEYRQTKFSFSPLTNYSNNIVIQMLQVSFCHSVTSMANSCPPNLRNQLKAFRVLFWWKQSTLIELRSWFALAGVRNKTNSEKKNNNAETNVDIFIDPILSTNSFLISDATFLEEVAFRTVWGACRRNKNGKQVYKMANKFTKWQTSSKI